MATNNEREELHRTIWSIADELRGSVDGWDFKQYILGIMFYRYISEYLANFIDENEHKSGNKDFSYAAIKDEEAETVREEMVNAVGFFILPSELFCNVRDHAQGNEDLNVTLENVFKHIEGSASGTSSEGDFSGLFDDIDVNSNKLGSTVAKRNEKLATILERIGKMPLTYSDSKIDAFGDAYEYLIVYDPACGSGSLLLQAENVLGKGKVHRGFFGQEINITTYNLCRINMFLHGIGFDKFNIACEDTLIAPEHWDDEPFEVIVSNPPYSIKWAGDDNPLLINDPRFAPAGVLAPKSKADLAFIMHSLAWLKTNGTAAIVCFPGVMYRGGAEQKIRKYLIDNNFVDCVIQLPDNLFFGTSITTNILVLKKNKADTNVLFIDASEECEKVTNGNRLAADDISRIVSVFKDRNDIDHFAKNVSYETISQENKYNLSVSSYVARETEKETVDINELNAEIKRIVAKEEELRVAINKIIEEIDA